MLRLETLANYALYIVVLPSHMLTKDRTEHLLSCHFAESQSLSENS